MKTYSKTGLQLTEGFEQCRLVAYKDRCAKRFDHDHRCTESCDGVWTIGFGHTMHVYQGMTITREEAERLLWIDVQIAVLTVNNVVKVPISQNEFDALVDLAINIGSHAFATSTLLRKLNANDFDGACDEFDRWVFDNGKRVSGLQRRRDDEQDLFDPEFKFHEKRANA